MTAEQRRERIAALKAAIKRGEAMRQFHMDGMAMADFYIRGCEEEFHALSTFRKPRRQNAKHHARLAIAQAGPLLKKRGKL